MTMFEKIAMRYVPKGYTVKYRKSLTGRHYSVRQHIDTPRPVTAKSLYIFLHECAHAHLRHSHNGKTSRHVEEMEAELWAHAKMAKHGIQVPPKITIRAKRYVARKIVQAERRGGKHFDPRAIEFAGEHLAAMRAKYNEVCGYSKHPNAHLMKGE